MHQKKKKKKSDIWRKRSAFRHQNEVRGIKTLNSLVVQNDIWPPNLIRWHPYVFNPIILHRDPSQFIVIPDLKQTDAPPLNNVAPLMT